MIVDQFQTIQETVGMEVAVRIFFRRRCQTVFEKLAFDVSLDLASLI